MRFVDIILPNHGGTDQSSSRPMLARSRSEYGPDSNSLVEDNSVRNKRKHGSVDGSSVVRRQLSISDLLKFSTLCHGELFPLIDQQKYQTKAPQSIYAVDSVDSNEEIENYLTGETKLQQLHPPEATSTEISPTCSLKDRAGDVSYQSAEKDTTQFFCERFEGNVVETSREREYGSDTQGRVIITNTLTTAGSMNGKEREKSGENDPSLRFCCIMEYTMKSRQLKIQIVPVGQLLASESARNVKLFAKMCLIPGHIQKQRLKILPPKSGSTDVPEQYICRLTPYELEEKKLDIKIYLRRGIFKKSKLLCEWSIPLNSVNMKDD